MIGKMMSGHLTWVASLGVLVVLLGDAWFCFVHQKAHEPLIRMLAADSGAVDALVTGEQSGDELDKLAKKLSDPPSYSLPFPTVWEYFAALWQWQPEGKPSIPDIAFTSANVSNVEDLLPEDYLRQPINESLRGLWCGPWHPYHLACFVPFASNTTAGTKRLPAQGFLPGHMLMWDSPGTRNTLEYFSRYELIFEFPKWYYGAEVGQGSSIWTFGRRPFDLIPYPAAVYEGLPSGHLFRLKTITGTWFWDAEHSKDPAVCFCSVRMEAPDVIVRNNFGKEAYRVYRVIDDKGSKTSHWESFQNWSLGRQIVKLNIPLHPHDTSVACTGWCKWDVFLQVLGFYFPLVALFACCCCLPCCGCYWCYKKKGVEESEDDEVSSSEEDKALYGNEADNL